MKGIKTKINNTKDKTKIQGAHRSQVSMGT